MSDNYICRAYKRNKNNPPWAGQWLIVTSNLSFSLWASECGIHVQDRYGQTSSQYAAIRSRFYICKIINTGGVNHLGLVCPSRRGSAGVQRERLGMFMGFKEAFNKVMAGYVPGLNEVDYSDYIDVSEDNHL